MGLFGGSKSSSNVSTDASQTTQSADGVVTNAKVFNVGSGGDLELNYADEFSNNVAEFVTKSNQAAISAITGATDKALSGFEQVTKELFDFSENTINTTKDSFAAAKQPDSELLKSVTSFIPYVLIGAIIVVGVIAYKK